MSLSVLLLGLALGLDRLADGGRLDLIGTSSWSRCGLLLFLLDSSDGSWIAGTFPCAGKSATAGINKFTGDVADEAMVIVRL